MEESPSLPLLYSSLSHPASSASNRCYPLQHPERTRFRLFRAFPGCVSLFLSSFDLQNLGAGFVTQLVAPPAFWGKKKAGNTPGLGKIALLFAQIQGIASHHFCGFICISLLDYPEG